MRTYRRAVYFAIVLALCVPIFAADDGQTQPKLNTTTIGSGVSGSDIVPQTSGAGNVKGVNCMSISSLELYYSSVSIYVNGGSAQTLALANAQYMQDSSSTYYTGYIPLNVRFTSSIKVRLTGSGSGFVSCSVSWGLD